MLCISLNSHIQLSPQHNRCVVNLESHHSRFIRPKPNTFPRVFFYSTEMRFRWGFARQAKHLSATVFLFSSTCAIDTSTASKFGDLISTASKFGDLISDRFKIRRFDFRSIYGVPLKMRWIPPKSIFLGSPPHFPGKYGWSAPRVFFRPISSIFFQY